MIQNSFVIPLCMGIAFFVFAAAGAGAEPNRDTRPQVPSITLEDQYGVTHKYTFPRERVLLVTISGQKGSKDMDPWLETLHEAYDWKIDFQGIADLSNVPFLARKLARAAIRKKSTLPVLCDWSGEVSQAFGPDNAAANVFLVSPEGKIVHRASGPMTEAALNEVRAAIEQFLASDATTPTNVTPLPPR
ncbi:MAG: hypothetical protein IID08_07380 [Candidatus Hydrogenedentes bacterium]|nr:hypothetical protein [Candidatus Hydrogenedentota bacterium]